MKYSVAIDKVALLTPLDGDGVDTWAALCAGSQVCDRGVVREELLAGTPAEMDRASRLAIAVARQVLRERQHPAAVFVGTSKGPILSQLAVLAALRQDGIITEAAARSVALGPAMLAYDLARALGLSGTLHTSVAACSSGLHALHRAVRAIEFGELESALVVAADASHHPLFEASFERLGVLARPDADGHRRCRPFDPRGAGFVLSEAAAALVLTRGTGGVAVERSGIGADATDIVAIDAQTVTLRHVLRQLVGSEAVDFVHAHATGTTHDAHELAAIRAVLRSTPPVVSSKGALGHSLGAAGLVSLALSVLCHRHGRLWSGETLPAEARSITISQGFGGHIAAVALLAR